MTTVPNGDAQDDALVIPVVGHAQGGLSSLFLSGMRITNASNNDVEYLLLYTPTRTSGTEGKQSRIVLQAQETKALNDVVRNWFGYGSTGESALGVLEVRPLGAGEAAAGLSTVASTSASSKAPASHRARAGLQRFRTEAGETTMSLLPFEHQQWNRLLDTLSVPNLETTAGSKSK